MSLNLSAPLLAAITESAIADELGLFNEAPSIHTRRPVPEDAEFPLITISPDITISDEDGVNDDRPVVQRDIAVYGEAALHYRTVETLGYALRTLFHRQRLAITVPGYDVIDIRVLGPRIAPVDDDARVGRLITLNIRLAATS